MHPIKSANAFGNLFLITLLLFASIFSTNAAVKVGKDRVIVRYTIKNPGAKSIDLYLDKVVETRHKVVPTLANTVFSDTIFTSNPVYPTFSTTESIDFYGEPGAIIKIQLDPGAGSLFDAKGRIINTNLERPEFIMEIKYLDKYLNDPEYQ